MFFVLKVFRFLGYLGFWYEDHTRKYDPKAHEKHPIHGRPTLLKRHVKKMKMKLVNLTSQLKFEYDLHLLNYTIKRKKT